MEKQSSNAMSVAKWLAAHPRVARVHYPGLASHPQHALAMVQQRTAGAIVSFEVKGEDDADLRSRAWATIDGCRLLSITGNLGDTKTTITHPASTTHGRLSADARRAAGVGEGLVRLAVGLESPEDICADLAQGLEA
jgi:O-succinylhomoserine sulfhydrylase